MHYKVYAYEITSNIIISYVHNSLSSHLALSVLLHTLSYRTSVFVVARIRASLPSQKWYSDSCFFEVPKNSVAFFSSFTDFQKMLTTFLIVWQLHIYTEMKGTHLLLTSQTSCRVMLIGIVFSVLHTAGILVSAYLMTERLLEPDLPEKPVFHVCTEALFCPFYIILNGLNGIAIQLLGSGKNFIFGKTFLLMIFLGKSKLSITTRKCNPPTFSRIFHPIFFWTIFLVKSKLS